MIKLLKCDSDTVPTLFKDTENSYEITQYLIDNVDWNIVFSVMVSLRRKYNTGAETFVKADIVAEAIEDASNGKVIYVNETGCDFIIPELNARMEMKSGQNIFPSSGGRYTTKLKLKNFRSLKNIEDATMTKTFDYLLIVEPNKCGVVSFDKIVPYLEIFSDGIGAKVDVNNIEFVKQVTTVNHTDILLFDRYQQMKKQIIQDVRENLYGRL